MIIAKTTSTKLDDVASRPPEKSLELTLQEVGLENVQSQLQVQGLLLPARSEACVSLVERQARGIHMSRLFKILSQMHEQELSWSWLTSCLEQMLISQNSLADSGRLRVSFELPVMRKALLSQEQGWRSYPLTYQVHHLRGGQCELTLQVQVLYSSTCPCSAGLSRQAMQDQLRASFSETHVSLQSVLDWLGKPESTVAVPHSQRSEAICEFSLDPKVGLPTALSLIDDIEAALGTPVQAAVKREDEQEFARLNAKNLMFCEDAARRLKAKFLNRQELTDFHFEVRHYESLHPHDVVAKVSKHD